mgnify:FL=1|tara:strand:+ start:421 stop:912 length:492 start_codon:yes stop_codon:yes gene_type:complete
MNFNPNLSPKEVVLLGSFGGSYFGFPIDEHTDYDYTSLFNYHFDGVDTFLYMGETYKPKLNQHKVRSGMGYQYWKDMGWMHEDDPYGWFEWYCKYSMGRRHQDDERQIKRWSGVCGPSGRWRQRIYKLIHETSNWNISPRIQQTLLHWGYQVNQEDYELWKQK